MQHRVLGGTQRLFRAGDTVFNKGEHGKEAYIVLRGQIDIRLERGLRALAAQGLTAEQMKKMDLQRLRAGQREQAIHDVKAALLLERVAEKENVQVSDEELNRELEALARQSKQTSEAVRARLTRDGGLDRIRTRIRNEKTLDFLYHQSA